MIAISSNKYIESILIKEGLGQSNSVSTPIDPNIPLEPNPKGNFGSQSNSFARLLRELQYIVNATCPDITYAVNRLGSYTANPSLQHVTALKHILWYLLGTRSHGIIYKVLSHQQELFFGFADAAYMNLDKCKSMSGYVFIASNGAITWSSKKQAIQVQSSTEAKYVALSEATHEACWLWNLHTELGLLSSNTPTKLYGDNEGSLAMARNPQLHQHSKHINLCWHWICQMVQDNIINVESCCDPKQTADVLTKVLPHPKHMKHVMEMGLASIWWGVLRLDTIGQIWYNAHRPVWQSPGSLISTIHTPSPYITVAPQNIKSMSKWVSPLQYCVPSFSLALTVLQSHSHPYHLTLSRGQRSAATPTSKEDRF